MFGWYGDKESKFILLSSLCMLSFQCFISLCIERIYCCCCFFFNSPHNTQFSLSFARRRESEKNYLNNKKKQLSFPFEILVYLLLEW